MTEGELRLPLFLRHKSDATLFRPLFTEVRIGCSAIALRGRFSIDLLQSQPVQGKMSGRDLEPDGNAARGDLTAEKEGAQR